MTSLFGDAYASGYDSFYLRKDYEQEVDLLEGVLRSHSAGTVSSVLDLGCGTGTHALSLATRGYQVLGVDRAEAMLKGARSKASNRSNPTFVLGDIRALKLDRLFDAVLMMFAVLSYQVSDQDMDGVLSSVRQHLCSDGLYLFDVWHAPAVLSIGPTVRSDEYETPRGMVRRTASGLLEPSGNVCRVQIQLEDVATGMHIDEELHRMRFFFPDELRERLAAHRLELLDLRSFPDTAREPDAQSWNVLAIAKAC